MKKLLMLSILVLVVGNSLILAHGYRGDYGRDLDRGAGRNVAAAAGTAAEVGASAALNEPYYDERTTTTYTTPASDVDVDVEDTDDRLVRRGHRYDRDYAVGRRGYGRSYRNGYGYGRHHRGLVGTAANVATAPLRIFG